MPLYYFNLKDRHEIIIDPEGTELADETEAREYAGQVARELMQNRPAATAAWRLQVCDAGRCPLFELLFATLGYANQPLDLRRTFIGISSNLASLYDTITDLRMTLRRIDNAMARAQGAPYLATLNGTRIDPATPQQSAEP